MDVVKIAPFFSLFGFLTIDCMKWWFTFYILMVDVIEVDVDLYKLHFVFPLTDHKLNWHHENLQLKIEMIGQWNSLADKDDGLSPRNLHITK